MSFCPIGVGTCAGVGGGVAANTFAAALQFLVHSQCLISEPWPQQATVQNGSSFDVIIVGAGTAGSALAARLAETNLTVLLLEAGGDPPIESIVPGFHSSFLHGQYCWNFTTRNDLESSQELENHRQRLSGGRLLGGTGSINYMIYSRSFPQDYDELADILGDDTWNWDNVLPYFKKTERMTVKPIIDSPSVQYHGLNGDIQVSGPETYNLDTVTLLDAFAELGFKVVDDRNNPENLSPRAYPQAYTVRDGKRQSSLTAMLNKVATRENLYVLKNAFVSKVLIENHTAYGVKVLIGDDEWEFYASKEVILSAGVYNTPKLLFLSGIGPHKSLLRTYGLREKKELPVGENLRDHVNTVTFLAADSDICSSENHFDAIQYLYDRTGPLSILNRMGVDYSLKNSANPEVPDFGIFPNCVPKGSDFIKKCLQLYDYTHEKCSYLHSLNKEHELFAIGAVLRKPKSRGLVTITSGDPLENPTIYTGAFMEEEDLDGFPEVIELIRSLVNTTYFKSKNAFVVDFKLKSCEGLEWPENIKCTVKSLAKFEGHAVGTAAMGYVLDSRMRVLEINRFRVVDASALPITLRSGTNAAVVMLAEKAADFIKEDHGIIHEHHHHHHKEHDHSGQDSHQEKHDHHGQLGQQHYEQHDYHKQHDDNDKQQDQNGHNGPDVHHDENDNHEHHDHHKQHDVNDDDKQQDQNDHNGPDVHHDENDNHEHHDHHKQHDDNDDDEQQDQNDHNGPDVHHDENDNHEHHDHHKQHDVNDDDKQQDQNDHNGPDVHHDVNDNHEHHDHHKQHDDNNNDEQQDQNDHNGPDVHHDENDNHELHDHHKQHDDNDDDKQQDQNDHNGPDVHHDVNDNHELHDHHKQHDHHDDQDFIIPTKDDLFYEKLTL